MLLAVCYTAEPPGTSQTMQPFAFAIATHPGDLRYCRILCASIRHFYPHLPIRLLCDGDPDVAPLARLGNVEPFEPAEAGLRSLRGLLTKLKVLALAEQYEHVLFLDADTVLTGPILRLPWGGCDALIDAEGFRHLPPDDKLDYIRQHCFAPEQMREFDPDFDCAQMLAFNSGAFFLKRGSLPVELCLQVLQRLDFEPQRLFRYGDQGLLNYLLNREQQRGRLRLAQQRFMLIPGPDPSHLRDYRDLTAARVLGRGYQRCKLLHYTTPNRHWSLAAHRFGDVLVAFENAYYRQLGQRARLGDAVAFWRGQLASWRGRLQRFLAAR